MEDLRHISVADDDDLSHFCCQNRRCPAFGTCGGGNLLVRDRIGKRKHIRLLYCKTCKKRFSENKGTVFYHAHLPREKVISILRHVQEGNGMRPTGRLEHVKEDTVIRYARLAGKHAPPSCTGNWWPFPPQTREVQLDEKWAFVYEKQDQCDPENQADHTAGDCWDHVAFDAEHRLLYCKTCKKEV
jgi:transposase-like protein